MKAWTVNNNIVLSVLFDLEKKKPENEVIKATIQCNMFILTTVGLIRIKKRNEIVTL
jgi:hypothetical protein